MPRTDSADESKNFQRILDGLVARSQGQPMACRRKPARSTSPARSQACTPTAARDAAAPRRTPPRLTRNASGRPAQRRGSPRAVRELFPNGVDIMDAFAEGGKRKGSAADRAAKRVRFDEAGSARLDRLRRKVNAARKKVESVEAAARRALMQRVAAVKHAADSAASVGARLSKSECELRARMEARERKVRAMLESAWDFPAVRQQWQAPAQLTAQVSTALAAANEAREKYGQLQDRHHKLVHADLRARVTQLETELVQATAKAAEVGHLRERLEAAEGREQRLMEAVKCRDSEDVRVQLAQENVQLKMELSRADERIKDALEHRTRAECESSARARELQYLKEKTSQQSVDTAGVADIRRKNAALSQELESAEERLQDVERRLLDAETKARHASLTTEGFANLIKEIAAVAHAVPQSDIDTMDTEALAESIAEVVAVDVPLAVREADGVSVALRGDTLEVTVRKRAEQPMGARFDRSLSLVPKPGVLSEELARIWSGRLEDLTLVRANGYENPGVQPDDDAWPEVHARMIEAMKSNLEYVRMSLLMPPDEHTGTHERPEAEPEEVRGQSELIRGEAEEIRGEAEEIRGEAEEIRGEAEEIRGEAEEIRGEAEEIGGEAEKIRGQADRGEDRSGQSSPPAEGDTRDVDERQSPCAPVVTQEAEEVRDVEARAPREDWSADGEGSMDIQ